MLLRICFVEKVAFVDSVGDFWASGDHFEGHVRWWTVHLPAGEQNKTPVAMCECFFTSNIFLFGK